MKSINQGFTRIIILLILSFSGHAQQGIRITEHGNISNQMSQFVSKNMMNPFINGWRIQILATNDRRKMERNKARFENRYPSMIVDWTQQFPYYKVKTGAFRDKMSYYPFLLEVKQEFPSAIPIMEKIRIEELLRS